MSVPTNRFVRELKERHGYQLIAGVDEVGCGCIAGPVVSAAVLLPEHCSLPALNDSKKLSPTARDRLDILIKKRALSWSVGLCTVSEIDTLGIRPATLLASKRALLGLGTLPDAVVSDAFFIPDLPFACHPLIRADSNCRPVAAASIIAKVYRDQWMMELDQSLPGYDFATHKGYGTKKHLDAIQSLGVCSIHRATFEPISSLLGVGKNHTS